MANRFGDDSLDAVEHVMSLDILLEDVAATFQIKPELSDVLPDPELVEATFGRLYDFVLTHAPVDRSDLSAPLTAKVFVRLRNAISSITGRMGLGHDSALKDLVDSRRLCVAMGHRDA